MIRAQVREKFRRRTLPRIGERVPGNRFTVEIEGRDRRGAKIVVQDTTLAVSDDVHWARYRVRGDRRPAGHCLEHHEPERVGAARDHPEDNRAAATS